MGLYDAECPACGGKYVAEIDRERYFELMLGGDGVLRLVHPIKTLDGHDIDGCIASLREQIDELRKLVERISVLGF